mgnify:CR=1 FL=1
MFSVRKPWEVRAIFQGQGVTVKRFHVYAWVAPKHFPWRAEQYRVSREYSADIFPLEITNSSALMMIITVDYSTTQSTGCPSVSTRCPWQRSSPSIELAQPISSILTSFTPGTLRGWTFFFLSLYFRVDTSRWQSEPLRLIGNCPTGLYRSFS